MQTLGEKIFWILGTSVAVQALGVLTIPILTKLYSPAEFGYFGQYSSVVVLLGTLTTLGLPLAIVGSRTLLHARFLASTAAILSLFICGVLIALVFSFSSTAFEHFPHGGTIAILMYLGAVLFAFARIGKTLETRRGKIKRQSKNNFLAAVTSNGFKVLMGYLNPNYLFLCVGGLLSNFVRANGLFQAIGSTSNLVTIFDKRYWSIASKITLMYRRYPVYIFPANFLSVAWQHALLLAISVFFGVVEAGLYVVVKAILGAPLKLLGSTFQDMFRAHLKLVAGAQAKSLVVKALCVILAVCAVFGVAVVIMLPHIVDRFLDQNWRPLTGVALALLPYYLSRLIVIPLSAFIIYRDRQDLIFKFEAFSSIIRLVYLCPLFIEIDYTEFLLVYSVSNCIAYSALCGTAIFLLNERRVIDASSR